MLGRTISTEINSFHAWAEFQVGHHYGYAQCVTGFKFFQQYLENSMWVNVPGSFSPCLLPMWLQVTLLALGVPRKRYSFPSCTPLLFLFHYRLYSTLVSMVGGPRAFSVVLMKPHFGAGTESQGCGLYKCSWLSSRGRKPSTASFLPGRNSFIIFLFSDLCYNGLPPILSCCRRLLFLREREVYRSEQSFSNSCCSLLQTTPEGRILRILPISPMRFWGDSWRKTCKPA